jgi:multiple sugar transport system permease protein
VEQPHIHPVPPRQPGLRAWRLRTEERYFPILLIAPSLLLILFVVAFPLLYSLYLSFTPFKLLKPDQSWVGLANYRSLFSDQTFWLSLRNTILFLAVTVNMQFLLGLLFAQMVARMTRGQALLRTALMVPMMLAPILVGFQFRWFFNAQVGLVNNFLRSIGLGEYAIAWLVERWSAMLAIMVADIWVNTPVVTIILLAGRLSLPAELEEAAEVDGASAWQTFRHVVLPQLMPFAFIALTIRSLDVARGFDIVRIMTGGGPANRTELLWTYISRLAFDSGDFAKGAAMSYITILISIGFTAYLFRQLIKARIVR